MNVGERFTYDGEAEFVPMKRELKEIVGFVKVEILPVKQSSSL